MLPYIFLWPLDHLLPTPPVHVILEAIPFFTISYHHTNFNLENLNLVKNSRANRPKVNHCTVTHIIQQDDHTFPSSFHLLDTSNDAIYPSP